MMRKIVWTTLGAALIVVGITAAWTQTRTWRGGRGPFWFHHGPMGLISLVEDRRSGADDTEIGPAGQAASFENFGQRANSVVRPHRMSPVHFLNACSDHSSAYIDRFARAIAKTASALSQRIFLAIGSSRVWQTRLRRKEFTLRKLYPFLYLRSLKIGHNLGYASNKRRRGGRR